MLVVDDEADFLATYRRLLGRHGYRVVTVASRVAALETLARERFAAVIADLRLADGDGLDVVRAARAGAEPPPVIVVSGFASSHARRAAHAAGAVEFFAKPFASAALAARVRELIDSVRPMIAAPER